MNAAVLDLSRPLAEIVARGEDANRIQDQARQVGGCEAPIRLRGRTVLVDEATGVVEEVFSTEALADGVLHTRCNNRRASRCEPCSRLYQGDAFQLVLAGLIGGKGVPDTILGHPLLFVTLTAPSFGRVHRAGSERCHARRAESQDRCEHSRPVTCPIKHDERDPRVGQPFCHECFDYAGAVLWNAHASELWRRTSIQIRRELARMLGISERQLRREVTVQYVKVAEYQRRGLVHFHILIRLDGTADDFAAPPDRYTADLLEQAVRAAVTHVSVPHPTGITGGQQPPEAVPQGRAALLRAGHPPAPTIGTAGPGTGPHTQPHHRLPDVNLQPRATDVRWGVQVDVREVSVEERAKVAGYLAKYSTKHTEAAGGLDRRVKAEDLALLPVNRHVHRLVVVAWLLAIQHSELRTDRWAHQLGFGGHFLTKSRRYSTTFTALRAAREQYRRGDQPDEPAGGQVVVKEWELAGVGWRLEGDALLARTVRREQREAREHARDQQRELAEVLAIAG